MPNYEIIYSGSSLYSVAMFVESLKLSRKRRYTNSGLESVLLVSSFDDEIDDFRGEILEFIEDKLGTGMLGVIQEKQENYYQKKVVFFIRSYILVLSCKQFFKEGVIIIENIEITK